ncbi:hypothetical protein [Brevibacterium antiquum]|uniref:Uncharacterized protein n=1 Tax=Brevibacterium antiquum TaxID=234835 RepID=A0A2H1IWH5_9MICO|nr:hypothetical protein [Brevibacterium antiquum]SMX79546.1 hypothetical protein BANT10_01367 [Brevibacterium antiquum]
MKTGLGGRIRYRTTTSIALTAALALPLVLSGCDDHSPVAAPTSTLPAKDPTAASPTADPRPTIPEYETELDLSSEETEAIEGALAAFEGYIATINRVFSSGGKDNRNPDKFARDDSLESLESEAQSMRSKGQYMAGVYKVYDVQIESVGLPDSDSGDNTVTILFCTRDSDWSVVSQGESLPSVAPRGITMQHVVNKVDGEWKVANQYLRSKECEHV